MDLRDKIVLTLGSAGLMELAVTRPVMEDRPERIVLGSLRKEQSGAPRRRGERLAQVSGFRSLDRARAHGVRYA